MNTLGTPVRAAAILAVATLTTQAQLLIFDPGTNPGQQSKPDQVFDHFAFGDLVLRGSYRADTLAITSSGVVDSWKFGAFGVGGDWADQTIMGEATPASLVGWEIELKALAFALPTDVNIWAFNIILVFVAPWDDTGGNFAKPVDLLTGKTAAITATDIARRTGVLTQMIFSCRSGTPISLHRWI